MIALLLVLGLAVALLVAACSGAASTPRPAPLTATAAPEPVSSLGDTGQHTGDMTVDGPLTFSGQVTGTMTVVAGGDLTLNGQGSRT